MQSKPGVQNEEFRIQKKDQATFDGIHPSVTAFLLLDAGFLDSTVFSRLSLSEKSE